MLQSTPQQGNRNMATNPTGPTPPSLLERVKNILMQPRAEWPRIDAEPATIGGIYTSYVMILAAIGPIAGLIGGQLIGVMGYKPPLDMALGSAVLGYVLSLIAVYVSAFIIDALAPSFGGTKDMVKAFKVAAYSSTAAWVAGIFQIIPLLAILVLIAALYGLYLLYLGLPILMRVPQDKAMGYVVVVIIVQIVLYFAIGMIVTALVLSFFGPMLPAAGTITYTPPG
jgi:Yip1-like protein